MINIVQDLPVNVQAVLKDFIEIIELHYKNQLHSVRLYGSYARKEAHEESDIDVLVILDKEEIDIYEEMMDIVEKTHLLDIEYEQILSTMPISLMYWENGDSFFLDRVKKDSVTLWKKELIES
ncbi:MAG: nucleotidyltransferase domain-containing protein [Bacteroidota bacterium]